MSIKDLTPDERQQIDAYPPHLIKRYSPGETSSWDDRPFRERHSAMVRKAATRRKSSRCITEFP